jgi:hypothetical protein
MVMKPTWYVPVITMTLLMALLMALLFGCGLAWAADILLTWHPFRLWKPKQVALAEDLGVSIEDYYAPLYFPYGYFYERLGRGTPISEVHRVVRGYQISYACEGDREVYYYFSTWRNRALRFEIWYDDRLRVSEVAGEDEDDRWISVEDCSPGLLAEAP